MAVSVFDPNGKLIYRGDTKTKDGVSSAVAVYDEVPGSSFWTAVEFLFENLQPAVFELASYLCGDYFDVAAGHRALFILPNSFLGMLGRGDVDENILAKQFVAFLFMLPSLILAVWLALRVRRDAILVGLSGTAKKWWIIGTIAFGLPAYITYRLTRPKETLVSCQNCGKMRRPDMETCHRCGSKWEISELTPPNWRICD
jgi:ribosomal protein L32